MLSKMLAVEILKPDLTDQQTTSTDSKKFVFFLDFLIDNQIPRCEV